MGIAAGIVFITAFASHFRRRRGRLYCVRRLLARPITIMFAQLTVDHRLLIPR